VCVDLRELWSLLHIIFPSFFSSVESFEQWFALPFEREGLLSATRAGPNSMSQQAALDAAADEFLNQEEKLLILNRLHRILRPFLLRREKKDVAADLPPKVEMLLKCPMSVWQTKLYERIQQHSKVASVGMDGAWRIMHQHNPLMALRKASNHPYLFEDRNPLYQQHWQASPEIVRCSGKFAALHRMLPKLLSRGHRILLFSQMTSLLDILRDYLQWRGLKFVRLDGDSNGAERAEAQSLFNAPHSDVPLFLLSTRAGGLGLNLQTADTVILLDSDWNPMMVSQCTCRCSMAV